MGLYLGKGLTAGGWPVLVMDNLSIGFFLTSLVNGFS